MNARTVYFYGAARFHSGLLSAPELMDTLLSVYRTRDKSDFSITGIQLNIMYPQYLLAYADYLTEEERPRYREEVCCLAYTCGLYHDLGKSMVINYIGIYGRRLLDKEFACIQYHPRLGWAILRDFPGCEDMSQVALRHHISYDGKGGYPQQVPPCPGRVREMVWITTVSDCMDAATDNVGRSYALAKSFDTLVEELFLRSGKAYAPEIVRLLEDGDFRNALGRELVQQRRRVYCEVYRELALRP